MCILFIKIMKSFKKGSFVYINKQLVYKYILIIKYNVNLRKSYTYCKIFLDNRVK